MPRARLTAARSEHYDDRKQIESYQNQHEFCGGSVFSILFSPALLSRPAPNLVLSGFSDASPLGYFIVKPFSKAGVAAILHHIQTECPEAHFDDVSTDMKTGDFASVTRQTLAARNILRIALASSGGMFVIVILKIIARH